MSNYNDLFSMIIITTKELQDKRVLESILQKGFLYIRRRNLKYNQILREPTIGCWVELFKVRQTDCVPIESVQGKKIIKRINYF